MTRLITEQQLIETIKTALCKNFDFPAFHMFNNALQIQTKDGCCFNICVIKVKDEFLKIKK